MYGSCFALMHLGPTSSGRPRLGFSQAVGCQTAARPPPVPSCRAGPAAAMGLCDELTKAAVMRLSQLTVQPTAQRTRRPPAAMDPGRLAPPRLSAAARPKAREPPPRLGRGGAGVVLWRLPGRCSPTCRHGPAAAAVIGGGGCGGGGLGGGGEVRVRSRGLPGSFGSASAVPRLACGRA